MKDRQQFFPGNLEPKAGNAGPKFVKPEPRPGKPTPVLGRTRPGFGKSGSKPVSWADTERGLDFRKKPKFVPPTDIFERGRVAKDIGIRIQNGEDVSLEEREFFEKIFKEQTEEDIEERSRSRN